MFSTPKFLAIIIAPIFSGTISFCSCSAFIICILRYSKVKLKRVVRRVLFMFCIYACIYAFSSLLSVSMVPAETSDYSVGNLTTCDIQGFMAQLGALGCIFYNLSLAIYHVCVAKFQMKEKEIAKKLEPLIHIAPNGFAIVSSIFLYAKRQYAPLAEQSSCWIGVYPQACVNDSDIECVRGGKKTQTYAKYLAIIPFFIVYLCILVITIVIIYEIDRQKRKSDRWRMRDKPESCVRKNIFGCIKKHRRRVVSAMKKKKSGRRTLAKSNLREGKVAVASNKGAASKKNNSRSVRFSHQNIKSSELRSKIAVGSRSGNKDDPLAFDMNKVKKKIRRESSLARDAPIIVSKNDSANNSKDIGAVAPLPVRNSLRNSSTHSNAQKSKSSRDNMVTGQWQCMLYHMSFLVCYSFSAASRIYGIMGKEVPFVLLLLARIFLPLNGFFLILVYSRPHVKALRSGNQGLSWVEAFVTVFKAGADNDLGESLYNVDEEGIDVPRLSEAERKRRQDIVREQFKRKSISYKYPSSNLGEIEQDNLEIPQGCDQNSDEQKVIEAIVTKEGRNLDIVDHHSTLSTSDIEACEEDCSDMMN